jgi:F-type H+-transporting ATPase subunit b
VLFDWFTIIAQIFNFLILMFLLRRFLYRPILNAMAAREERIAKLLEEAERKRREAEEERGRFAAKNEDWQATYQERKREMEVSLEDWRKEALRDARQQVDHTLKNWVNTIEDQKERFRVDLNQFAVRQTYAVARRAMHDLAGEDLETLMVNAFLENLKSQDLNIEQLTNGSAQANDGVLKLRSAFELSSSLKLQLQQSFQQYFDTELDLQYETSPQLISGIELIRENGYTTAWNLKRYLEILQDELDQQIHTQMGERSHKPDLEDAEVINDR